MIEYSIEAKYLCLSNSSSVGTQNKYFKDGYWYKQNVLGYEDDAEFLVSLLLKWSTVANYVEYERCLINGKPGCRSKNFLEYGEAFITFERLFRISTGDSLQDCVFRINSVMERKNFVLEFLKRETGLNLGTYLETLLQLDAITLNTDRHFHNLGVIKGASGYREAPIFDNGASLLSDYQRFPVYRKIADNCLSATAKPFSGSFYCQTDLLAPVFRIDFIQLKKEITELGITGRGTEVLLERLNQFKNFDISCHQGFFGNCN